MARRPVSVEERRARLGVRHRLTPTSRVDDDIAAIATSVVVLHATDPCTVVLSALVRMATPDPTAVERALYEDHTALRLLGMRRTVYTAALDVAPIVQASSGDAVAAVERKRTIALLQDSGIASDGARHLRRAERDALAAIEELGEVAVADLSKRVPMLAAQIPMAEGKNYETKIGVGSRVVFQLAAEGKVGRGRPRGLWTGSQHRWAPITRWYPDGMPRPDAADARAELVRRWLDRFGPGTEADLAWWTGWTLRHVRAALAALEVVEVEVDGATGYLLADDHEPVTSPAPWVALLPGLDPTTMGWKARGWYLPDEHRSAVFDRNGNAGPTVWVDGRVVGGWAQRTTGDIVVRLLEDVGRDRHRAIERRGAELEKALGALRFVPRFRTPLERELMA